MSAPRRPRGRPAGADAQARREALLQVARSHFASKGYQGASLRAIATEAGVDVALISHYFGGKPALLVATMQLPVDPIEKISGVVADGPEGLASRLISTFLASWDPHRDVFATLIRTSLASPEEPAPMLQVGREILLTALEDVLEGDDRELRASLVASQMMGMATLRYVAKLGAIADAPAEHVVRLFAPAMQHLIDGHA